MFDPRNEVHVGMMRHICQHHFAVPVLPSRLARPGFISLESEELEALNDFVSWVCDHGLEYACEAYAEMYPPEMDVVEERLAEGDRRHDEAKILRAERGGINFEQLEGHTVQDNRAGP